MGYGPILLGSLIGALVLFVFIGCWMASQFSLSMHPLDCFFASAAAAEVFTLFAVGGFWLAASVPLVLGLVVHVVSVTIGFAAGYLLLQEIILSVVRGVR